MQKRKKCIVNIIYIVIFLFSLVSPVRGNEKLLNGKILEINEKHQFVIINMGKELGVKKGMIFLVYRDEKLLGKIEIEDVFPKMSSGKILLQFKWEKFKIDDGVLSE